MERTNWSKTCAIDSIKMQNYVLRIGESSQDATLVQSGVLYDLYGTRSIPWRIYLGLLSTDPNKWADELVASRKIFTDLVKSQSMKEKIAQDKNYNPLANISSQETKKDKEIKDLIRADVNRTCQEYQYFRNQSTKDNLYTLLYVWSKQSTLGYKQGMNEILAVILAVFDTERNEQQEFDSEYLLHDVYSFFDCLMSKGIIKLYQEQKDITELKEELQDRETHKLVQMQPSRRQLEIAQEREKKKSDITQRCSKIYDQCVRRASLKLFSHLKNNEVIPELHLTRWLRCVLSREFCIDQVFQIWDYLFYGVYTSDGDPFENLNYVCAAMILIKRADLLDSQDSACLGILMSYQQPDSVIEILEIAQKIKQYVVDGIIFEYDSSSEDDEQKVEEELPQKNVVSQLYQAGNSLKQLTNPLAQLATNVASISKQTMKQAINNVQSQYQQNVGRTLSSPFATWDNQKKPTEADFKRLNKDNQELKLTIKLANDKLSLVEQLMLEKKTNPEITAQIQGVIQMLRLQL